MQKKFIFINGNTCTGKTEVAQKLLKTLPNCAWLDVDWCLKMHPKVASKEISALRYQHCCLLLNDYLQMPMLENVIFSGAIDNQKRIDQIFDALDLSQVGERVHCFILTANEKVYQQRFRRAIKQGKRRKYYKILKEGKLIDEDNVTYHLTQMPKYEQLNGIKIDTSELTIDQVVAAIVQAVQ